MLEEAHPHEDFNSTLSLPSFRRSKKNSSFKKRSGGDNFEQFEGQFPFYLYPVTDVYRLVTMASSKAMGGDGQHCNMQSLIASFSQSEETYFRYE